MGSRDRKEKAFSLDELTMRELQTFLLILQYEGVSLPVLKKHIDTQFNHKSRTKGYDYINALCQKGFVFKKKVNKKGKDALRIFISQDTRKKYEKLILPTLNNIKEAITAYMDDFVKEVGDTEKIREKFSNYTDSLKKSIINIVKNSPINEKENKRLQKKILEECETNLKVELVKYQLFSR